MRFGLSAARAVARGGLSAISAAAAHRRPQHPTAATRPWAPSATPTNRRRRRRRRRRKLLRCPSSKACPSGAIDACGCSRAPLAWRGCACVCVCMACAAPLDVAPQSPQQAMLHVHAVQRALSKDCSLWSGLRAVVCPDDAPACATASNKCDDTQKTVMNEILHKSSHPSEMAAHFGEIIVAQTADGLLGWMPSMIDGWPHSIGLAALLQHVHHKQPPVGAASMRAGGEHRLLDRDWRNVHVRALAFRLCVLGAADASHLQAPLRVTKVSPQSEFNAGQRQDSQGPHAARRGGQRDFE